MAGSEIGGQIKTRVDELIKLIAANPQITAPDAAKRLGVAQEMVESWARFLEKAGDIKIVYKGLTPTFITAGDAPEPAPQDASNPVEEHHTLHDVHAAIETQVAHISEAIKAKTFESIRPALDTMRDQIARIRDRIASASIEAEDRRALEQSIERVEGRIESIDENADQKHVFKLKSDSKRLSHDLADLKKRLPDMPLEAQLELEEASEAESRSDETPSFDLRIEELEREIREAISAGDVEGAEERSRELQQLYDSTLPQRYEQVRTDLKNRLYTLKKDITFASDESTKRAFTERYAKIQDLIGRYEGSSAEHRWDLLEGLERQIVELYNELPVGYETEKKQVEERFGSLIMTAARERRTELSAQLERITKVMEESRSAMREAIAAGDFTTAQQAYRHLRQLLDEVPAQLVIERIDIQSELLEEFTRLTGAFKERFIARNEAHIERCTHLIEHVKDAIKAGDIASAQQHYEHALAELEHIDHNYFEQRSRLQYDLMRTHKDLLDRKASAAATTFEDVVSSFQTTLQDGRGYVLRGEQELAESIYLKLLEFYRKLPAGNEERKRALKDQIFDYYKSLMSMDSSQPEDSAYLNDVLERFVAIHHALNAGDPSVLGDELTRVEQLVDALPDRQRKQNPALDRELIRLTHLRQIYEGVLEANHALDSGDDPADAVAFVEESERWLDTGSVSAAAVAVLVRALKRRLGEHTRAVHDSAAQQRSASPKTDAPTERAHHAHPDRTRASHAHRVHKGGVNRAPSHEPAAPTRASVPVEPKVGPARVPAPDPKKPTPPTGEPHVDTPPAVPVLSAEDESASGPRIDDLTSRINAIRSLLKE